MLEFSILILVTIFITGLIVVWLLWTSIIGAGFEPTSGRIVQKMMEMAEISSNDVVYDLGSGDGRIVIKAAKKYNAMAVGIEADPLRVIWSRLVIIFSRIENKPKIIWGNFFSEKIVDATIVTLFLGPNTNQKLKRKLQKELKPGTFVVSYIWTFNEWTPIKIDKEERIYLYIVGEGY